MAKDNTVYVSKLQIDGKPLQTNGNATFAWSTSGNEMTLTLMIGIPPRLQKLELTLSQDDTKLIIDEDKTSAN